MPGPPVVLFLSTGRCGTQWLAVCLAELYPELWVEHEPIGPLYAARRHFRRYEDPEAVLDEPAVANHVEEIERTGRPYVETGWPLFPVLPLLARRIPERLRIVHLTRHPVPSALSHLAHNSFAGSPREDAFTHLATLAPQDPRVFGAEYAPIWARLSPYEKCLFWWTEVHQFGLELPGRLGGIPFLRLQAERMLSGELEVLEELLAFMGLAWRPQWTRLTSRRVDRWRHHTDREVDPLQVREHPRTVRVAQALGYTVDDLDPEALLARYRGEPDPGLDRIGRYAQS